MELSKQHILDTFAVAIAGLNTDVGRIISAYAKKLGGTPDSTIIGGSQKVSAETAALANATLAHAHDYDDDCVVTVSHPGAVLVPAIFALAEVSGSSGRDVIEAFILGIETMRRVSDVVNMQHYLKGWHPTSTLGVLGAAAGCARVLKLNVEQTRNAFAIAGSLASGIIANFGTMTKPLHAGHAAQGAVMAARLAGQGFTGHKEIFEHPRFGFFELFCGEKQNPPHKWKKLGDPYHIVDPGVIFKKYPCCLGLHATIDGALHLTRSHNIGPDKVAKAETIVEQMLIDTLSYGRPCNPNEARFSLPYALAVSICRRKAGIKEFLSECLLDPQIQNLIQRCQPVAKPGPPSGRYSVDAQVRITMKDGTVYEHFTETCIGPSVINSFSRSDSVRKLNECYAFAYSSGDTSPLLKTVLDDFESLKDMREVAGLLAHQLK